MLTKAVIKHKTPVILILIAAFAAFQACRTEVDNRIIGVKIYEHQGSFEALCSQWNELGINAAFSSLDILANDDYRTATARHQISTFVIFPVFFNPDKLAESPEYYAITSKGKQAREEWVEFVCPSRGDYRRQMVEKAKEIVMDHDPDGISIDFIRHFVFWEKVYPDRDPDSLPVTCFDSTCLTLFQHESGIQLPDSLNEAGQSAAWILTHHQDAWTQWRSTLITSMVDELAEAVREIKPNILVNVHLVPWSHEDYNGAGKRIAGQDIPELSKISDYLSPMTYAHMVKRDPEWIHSIVEDFYLQSGGKVLPSIQVSKAYLENELGLKEFELSLKEALKPPSEGVVFWSWERLVQDPGKLKVLQDILEN